MAISSKFWYQIWYQCIWWKYQYQYQYRNLELSSISISIGIKILQLKSISIVSVSNIQTCMVSVSYRYRKRWYRRPLSQTQDFARQTVNCSHPSNIMHDRLIPLTEWSDGCQEWLESFEVDVNVIVRPHEPPKIVAEMLLGQMSGLVTNSF